MQLFNKIETKNVGQVQQGGTATILLQSIFSKYVKKTGKNRGSDHTHLRRWSWYTLKGEPGYRTKVIAAYAPVGGSDSTFASNWKHQLRYIQNNNLSTTLFKMFGNNLCTLLKSWRRQGDRIILLMDTNDNMYKGKLSQRIADNLIELKEAVHEATAGQGPNTHIRGSEPIDGVWHIPKMCLQSASYLSFDPDLGNHRPVVADFSQDLVLGVNLPRIVSPKARKLNSKVDRIQEPYIKHTEISFRQDKVLERLREIDRTVTLPLLKEEKAVLEKIYKVMKGYMVRAEKKCRKLYSNHYEFSPTVKLWLDRCHLYQALIRSTNKLKELNTKNLR